MKKGTVNLLQEEETMYGKLKYDPITDKLQCEYPVADKKGKLVRCGVWRDNLSKHINLQHKITTKEYKRMMGLEANLPLVSKKLQAKWRKANKELKLYKNLEAGKAYRFKKGENTVQSYKRSTQTKRRLRTLKLNKSRIEKKSEV